MACLNSHIYSDMLMTMLRMMVNEEEEEEEEEEDGGRSYLSRIEIVYLCLT